MVDLLNYFGAQSPDFPPNSKISFIAIVLFRPCPAHYNRCSFSKKMIQRRPMGSILQPSDFGSGGTKGVEFIRCVHGRKPQIHEIWCLGSNGVTHKVHQTSQIDVGAETVRQFWTQYFDENGRIIPVISQISINRSIQMLGIPADAWVRGLPFIENTQAPTVPSGWGDANNSNQN